MTSLSDWKITPSRQPDPGDYRTSTSIARSPRSSGLRSIVPGDAFTADVLGTERGGHGVVIRDGVVLTIGYLITEAEEIWISLDGDQRHPRPSARLRPGDRLRAGAGARTARSCRRCRSAISSAAELGSRVVMAGSGGRHHSLAARIVAKQEFAGYWEYVLDEAIFTAPAHPFWGGAALLDAAGSLIGIGSLQVEQRTQAGEGGQLNMVVPIDLLKPILGDLLTSGQREAPTARLARPLRDRSRREGVHRRRLFRMRRPTAAGLKPGDLSSPSAASLFRALRASSEKSGRSARRASRCRSPFSARASGSRRASRRATAKSF